MKTGEHQTLNYCCHIKIGITVPTRRAKMFFHETFSLLWLRIVTERNKSISSNQTNWCLYSLRCQWRFLSNNHLSHLRHLIHNISTTFACLQIYSFVILSLREIPKIIRSIALFICWCFRYCNSFRSISENWYNTRALQFFSGLSLFCFLKIFFAFQFNIDSAMETKVD